MTQTLKTFLAATIAAVGLSMAHAPPADAQQVNRCANHDKLAKQLGDGYKEKLKAIGVVGKKAIVEVFVADSGSFTILVTRPNGLSCVLAAGHSWDNVPAMLAGDAT